MPHAELARDVRTLGRPGDHVCMVYDDLDAWLAAVVAFLDDGLERGDRCVYIAHDGSGEAVGAALASAGRDVRRERQRGALAIVTQADTYFRGGAFEPRAMVEYQLNRAIFFRLVGQYAARSRAPLEDRNGNAILVDGVADGGFVANEFRMDWLFSYRPIPGTLVYLGYGSTMQEPDEFQFNDLQRTTDGFFAKVSYLFRL